MSGVLAKALKVRCALGRGRTDEDRNFVGWKKIIRFDPAKSIVTENQESFVRVRVKLYVPTTSFLFIETRTLEEEDAWPDSPLS